MASGEGAELKESPIFLEAEQPRSRFAAWPFFLVLSVVYSVGMSAAALGRAALLPDSGADFVSSLSYGLVALAGGLALVGCAAGLLVAVRVSARRPKPARIVGTVTTAVVLLAAASLPFVLGSDAVARLDFAANRSEREAVVHWALTESKAARSGSDQSVRLPSFVPRWQRGLVSAGERLEVDAGGSGPQVVFYCDRGFFNTRIVYDPSDAAPPGDLLIQALGPHWYQISGDTGGI
jgi:hypothetical protein